RALRHRAAVARRAPPVVQQMRQPHMVHRFEFAALSLNPPPAAGAISAVEQVETRAGCGELPADLHYVDDSAPGIGRRLLRGKFAYFDPDGTRIRDPQEVQR